MLSRPGILAAALLLAAAIAPRPAAAVPPTARYNHSMTLMSDGNTLVVGGRNTAGVPLTTVEILISTAGTMEARASLLVTRASHTATLLPNGTVLVAGGAAAAGDVVNCDAGGGTICSVGLVYDPRTDAWTAVGAMQFPRVNHTATLLPTGKVLITGGQTTVGGAVTTDCDIYDPATLSFTTTPCGAGGTMQMERAGHTATLLHNGRVFAVSGYRSTGNGFAPTSEIYDPVADRWSAGPGVRARAWHTATQMGDRRVLIIGGANGANLKENQGILETTEIFDPNDATITQVAPMQERKMFHTANLYPSGEVSVYGGLGNITTSYFQGGMPFLSNSPLGITPVAGTWTEGTIINGAPSAPQVTPNLTLSVGATGRVVDGEILYSSPTAQLSDVKVEFDYPGATLASIDGATVDHGSLRGQTFTVTTVSGKAHFNPQTSSSKDVTLTAVSQFFVPGGLPPSPPSPIGAGSTLSGTIIVPMPASDVGGQIVSGAAIITNGAITVPSIGATKGFTVALTSGVAIIGGNPSIVNTINGPAFSAAVSFTGITGTITSSTDTTIASPISVVGQLLTGLQLKIFYTVSPIALDGVTLQTDISTIVIRSMAFSDNERYSPKDNKWTFGVPGSPSFSHAETLFPNGDEVIYGGRACSSFATCTAFNYSALTGPLAYIFLQQSPFWNAAGDLNDARSNHTLTLLPDGRVLAAGGGNGVVALASSELYDPGAHTWARTGALKQRRSHHTANLLADGTVVAAGGFTSVNQSTGTTNHAEVFYPGPGAWVPTGPMVSSRAYHASVLLPNGNILAIGGFSDGTYLDSVELYISTAHRWAPVLPVMNQPRAQFTATLLQDGRILVVGGINAANGILNTSRLFNPVTMTWANGPALNTARYSHTATLLRDGRVLIVGGDNGTSEIGKAEIYDPAVNPPTGQFFQVALAVGAGGLGGNDLGVGRLGHSAVLLPNGKVLFVGGFTRLGGPILDVEGFDVDFSTFQMQGRYRQTQPEARGDNALVLLKDGFLLNVGGSDGVNASVKTETQYFGAFPDAVSPVGAPARQPAITAVSPALFAPGTPVTVLGSNLRGRSEASGGGAAGANSSHSHPRVYLQRADGSSSSGNDSGWMVDLTSGMFNSGANAWANMDSSLTFTVPYTSNTMPFGWYHLRVAADAVFSDSRLVEVGPALPLGVPGIPAGTAVGPSSISWTWPAAGGAFDAYSVYSATNGVFITTVARSGGASDGFIQRDLGPDTSSLIKVAAYNISGDGSVVVATIPVLTAVSGVGGLQGLGTSPNSIFWSWDPVAGAQNYLVFSATNGVQLANVLSPSFTQTLISTNTSASIAVQAIMPGGGGILSGSATAFTLAAPPNPGSPPLAFVSTGGFTAQWTANTNPGTTKYELQLLVGAQTVPIHISSIQALSARIEGVDPNTPFALSVAAQNGDGKFTGFVSLGSTYTFARAPTNLRVVFADPSQVSLAWDRNNNPFNTAYQVLVSSDNFATDFSTPIPFSLGFTSATTSVPGLITSRTYFFRVNARNGFGQETSATSTQAFTDNGGGPPGSLSLLLASTVYASLSGTLGSGRKFSIAVFPGTFDSNTRVFITSRSIAADLPFQCGGIPAAISITALPAAQPKFPIEIGLQYNPAEAGALPTLGMSRLDPVTRTCVPLECRVDATNNVVYARVNHFSDFQLQQLTPASGLGDWRIFPNPLYVSQTPYITFDRLPAGARVRVYTLHGEELFDATTNASGLVTWRAENKVGRPVASGVYLGVVQSGGDKKILKLGVVR